MIPSVQVLDDTSPDESHKGVICQPNVQILHGTLESDDKAYVTSAPDLSPLEDLEQRSFRSEVIQPNISDSTPAPTSTLDHHEVDHHEDEDDMSNKNPDTSIRVSATDLEQPEVFRPDGLDPNPIPISDFERNLNVVDSEDQNSDTSTKVPTKIPASASPCDVPSHLSGSGEIPYGWITMFALVAGFCVVAVPHTCRLFHSR